MIPIIAFLATIRGEKNVKSTHDPWVALLSFRGSTTRAPVEFHFDNRPRSFGHI